MAAMRLITCRALFLFVLLSCTTAGREGVVISDTPLPLQKDLQSKDLEESVPMAGKSKKTTSFLTHPVTLGLLLGLLLIGPDHLGTIMALSTLTTGLASFKIGFSWGLGHSMGMITICPIFFFLRKWSSQTFHFSTEQWEYLGDYFIGASMVLVAIYFVVYESSYMEKQTDGSYKAKSCACHGSAAGPHETSQADQGEEQIEVGKFCATYCKSAQIKFNKCATRRGKRMRPGMEATLEKGVAAAIAANKENTPLLQTREGIAANFISARSIQGVVLGALQGLCCPMGLAGVGFMGHMGTTSSPSMLAVFALVFVLASAVGSGAISLCWGELTARGAATCVSPRAMYLSSCVATFLLGTCWIAANATGVLHTINFAEEINHKLIASVQ